MTPEKIGKADKGKIYDLLLPKSLFGHCTEEQMDQIIALHLSGGLVMVSFEFLEDELKKIVRGEEGSTPKIKEAVLLSSAKTIVDLLKFASEIKLPVNKKIQDDYEGAYSWLAKKDRGMTAVFASNILQRQQKKYDPFIRRLGERDALKITEVPIYVDQLNLITTIFFARFRDSLGKDQEDERGYLQYLKSVGVLHRMLTDVRGAHLGLPVLEKAICLIDVSYRMGLDQEFFI